MKSSREEMKVLFSHSYFLRFDQKQWSAAQPYPPYGTILAAECLREMDNEVSLFDSQFASSADEVIPYFRKFNPEVFVIYDDGFNYLTKMCLTKMREAAFEMQKIAKQYACKVILCSSDSSDHAEKYLLEGADFVIRGEGEEVLQELITCLKEKREPDTIAGLVFIRSGKIISNAKREVMKDLDRLPMPAWDLVDIDRYRSIWIAHHGYFSLNVATTRGCPYKCNWCAKPIYGNRYNTRSPQHVIDELLFLKSKFNFDHIWFSDDIFGLKPGWVMEFADLTEKHGLQLEYKIQSRADLLVQENYVSDLHRSGCKTVWMGAESGSQKVLDAMDKGTTIQQIKEATHLLRKHNMAPAFFLQFGYPGETNSDVQMTLDLVDELKPDDIGISVSYPLPGTKFYEKVKEELSGKANWTDSNDLDLMFKSKFSNEYYRTLHRYVHRKFRKKQGLASLRRMFMAPHRFNKRELRNIVSTPYHFSKERRERELLKKMKDGRS